MNLKTMKYKDQQKNWPSEGKHILAQYTQDKIVVYQAYKPSIGKFAHTHQYFGGEFSYSRMSWIKPNFLWMMYRSGWGSKEGQEITLAIHLKRSYFMSLLENAYPSTNIHKLDKGAWKNQISKTNVRLQWDPDHDPYGAPLKRKAIQLGLRHEYLEPFKGDGVIEIEDISGFVQEQRKHVEENNLDELITPEECPLTLSTSIRQNLGMDSN